MESLEDLRYLEIAYAAKLESLDVFARGSIELRELAISKAKKITSYQPIAALQHLRRLRHLGCTPMAHVNWTQGLDYLDSFSFVETNVEDGDLFPLLLLPRLRYVGTLDKKHYNYKCDDFNQLLSQRAGLGPMNSESATTGKQ